MPLLIQLFYGGFENMVANAETAIQSLENLVSVREYQGSSYGHIPFSGGEPAGHYRTLQFSTGVFSARDNRFNAYLRDHFTAAVLALYNGTTPEVSAEGLENVQSGYAGSPRQVIDGKVVEMNYWSNAQRGSILPNDRMYTVTVRLEAMPQEIDALQERVSAYLLKLQQTFGLESTNKVAKERRAA